jgi:hypothetical protein
MDGVLCEVKKNKGLETWLNEQCFIRRPLVLWSQFRPPKAKPTVKRTINYTVHSHDNFSSSLPLCVFKVCVPKVTMGKVYVCLCA